jgi:hypothetical protein
LENSGDNSVYVDPYTAIRRADRPLRSLPPQATESIHIGEICMSIIRLLETVFLWPGDRVRRWLGIEVEEDGGIIRSFVNMTVWGAVTLVVALRIF